MFAQTVEWHHTPLTFVPVPCMPDTTDNSRSMGRSDAVADFLKLDDKVTKGGELWATATAVVFLPCCGS